MSLAATWLLQSHGQRDCVYRSWSETWGGGPQGKPWKNWYGRENESRVRPGTVVLTAALVSTKLTLLNPHHGRGLVTE